MDHAICPDIILVKNYFIFVKFYDILKIKGKP